MSYNIVDLSGESAEPWDLSEEKHDAWVLDRTTNTIYYYRHGHHLDLMLALREFDPTLAGKFVQTYGHQPTKDFLFGDVSYEDGIQINDYEDIWGDGDTRSPELDAALISMHKQANSELIKNWIEIPTKDDHHGDGQAFLLLDDGNLYFTSTGESHGMIFDFIEKQKFNPYGPRGEFYDWIEQHILAHGRFNDEYFKLYHSNHPQYQDLLPEIKQELENQGLKEVDYGEYLGAAQMSLFNDYKFVHVPSPYPEDMIQDDTWRSLMIDTQEKVVYYGDPNKFHRSVIDGIAEIKGKGVDSFDFWDDQRWIAGEYNISQHKAKFFGNKERNIYPEGLIEQIQDFFASDFHVSYIENPWHILRKPFVWDESLNTLFIGKEGSGYLYKDSFTLDTYVPNVVKEALVKLTINQADGEYGDDEIIQPSYWEKQPNWIWWTSWIWDPDTKKLIIKNQANVNHIGLLAEMEFYPERAVYGIITKDTDWDDSDDVNYQIVPYYSDAVQYDEDMPEWIDRGYANKHVDDAVAAVDNWLKRVKKLTPSQISVHEASAKTAVQIEQVEGWLIYDYTDVGADENTGMDWRYPIMADTDASTIYIGPKGAYHAQLLMLMGQQGDHGAPWAAEQDGSWYAGWIGEDDALGYGDGVNRTQFFDEYRAKGNGDYPKLQEADKILLPWWHQKQRRTAAEVKPIDPEEPFYNWEGKQYTFEPTHEGVDREGVNAYDGADLVGSITWSDEGDYIYLRSAYVDPAYRGAGLFKELLAHIPSHKPVDGEWPQHGQLGRFFEMYNRRFAAPDYNYIGVFWYSATEGLRFSKEPGDTHYDLIYDFPKDLIYDTDSFREDSFPGWLFERDGHYYAVPASMEYGGNPNLKGKAIEALRPKFPGIEFSEARPGMFQFDEEPMEEGGGLPADDLQWYRGSATTPDILDLGWQDNQLVWVYNPHDNKLVIANWHRMHASIIQEVWGGEELEDRDYGDLIAGTWPVVDRGLPTVIFGDPDSMEARQAVKALRAYVAQARTSADVPYNNHILIYDTSEMRHHGMGWPFLYDEQKDLLYLGNSEAFHMDLIKAMGDDAADIWSRYYQEDEEGYNEEIPNTIVGGRYDPQNIYEPLMFYDGANSPNKNRIALLVLEGIRNLPSIDYESSWKRETSFGEHPWVMEGDNVYFGTIEEHHPEMMYRLFPDRFVSDEAWNRTERPNAIFGNLTPRGQIRVYFYDWEDVPFTEEQVIEKVRSAAEEQGILDSDLVR